MQVFCERLGFIDADVVGKPWYGSLHSQPAYC